MRRIMPLAYLGLNAPARRTFVLGIRHSKPLVRRLQHPNRHLPVVNESVHNRGKIEFALTLPNMGLDKLVKRLFKEVKQVGGPR